MQLLSEMLSEYRTSVEKSKMIHDAMRAQAIENSEFRVGDVVDLEGKTGIVKGFKFSIWKFSNPWEIQLKLSVYPMKKNGDMASIGEWYGSMKGLKLVRRP